MTNALISANGTYRNSDTIKTSQKFNCYLQTMIRKCQFETKLEIIQII